jgi:hypothetical protein
MFSCRQGSPRTKIIDIMNADVKILIREGSYNMTVGIPDECFSKRPKPTINNK